MVPKPNLSCGQMFAVNKTTVLKTEDVADEELKQKVEDDAMATFEPHENDVLCGRGGSINNHAGNERYRLCVNQKKRVYLTARFKREKRLIAASIVQSIRSLNPPGRFLQRNAKTGVWHDIGDIKARDKSSQALREGAPDIRKEIENDRKIMMTSNNDEDDDDDYGDEDDKFTNSAVPTTFKPPSRESHNTIDYIPGSQHVPVHGMSPVQAQHDPRQHGHSPNSSSYRQPHPSQQSNGPNQGQTSSPGPHSHWPPETKSNSRDSAHSHLPHTRSDRERGTHSPSYHQQPREQRHSNSSHPSMQYGGESSAAPHQRDHHQGSPDEYRYSRYNNPASKSQFIPAVQPSKSWGGEAPLPDNYVTPPGAYSRYPRGSPTGSQKDQQRQLNYSSSRGGLSANTRDRPDTSPIRSPHDHSSAAYYNDSHLNDSATMSQHHRHHPKNSSPRRLDNAKFHNQGYPDNRHLLAPTPTQPDGQYFDPNTLGPASHQHDINYSENRPMQHYYPNRSNPNFYKQSSSWAEGDAEDGCHPDMPPPETLPSMRLPSWDSDYASNIDNASVAGDINIFDHDVIMADSAPSNNVFSPKNHSASGCNERQLVESSNHDRQIVESRTDKDNWASRVPGCFNNIMSQEWSKIFHSNSFDNGFCGMELCGNSKHVAIEDDGSKVINNFYNSAQDTAPPHASEAQQHQQQQFQSHGRYPDNGHRNNGVTINTHNLNNRHKPMQSWDSGASGGISPFGSEIGSGFSKNMEPLPIHANTTDYTSGVSSNIYSSDIPEGMNRNRPPPAVSHRHHYQPHPMEANYYA